MVALKPLHDAATIKRVVVSTYQSVSGAGKAGMDELWDQTKGVFVLGPTEPKKFPKQIAFNVIPFIGAFMDDGYTDEEAKMWNETHKMLDPAIKLTVTCVRVPVMVGHSEAVNLEFEHPLDEDEAREILREAPGVMVVDKRDADRLRHAQGSPGRVRRSIVSRIRKDPTVENGLDMWVVSDNLRKGAALNAVQIAELAARARPDRTQGPRMSPARRGAGRRVPPGARGGDRLLPPLGPDAGRCSSSWAALGATPWEILGQRALWSAPWALGCWC